LDVGSLSKWIIYVNHELLDTNIDQMFSVSVDQQWALIIEASNYKSK
jgi:plasmid maintenance system killer protein